MCLSVSHTSVVVILCDSYTLVVVPWVLVFKTKFHYCNFRDWLSLISRLLNDRTVIYTWKNYTNPMWHWNDSSVHMTIVGAAVAEWLSSWLAEQEDRGSIPGLATWIFRDWLSPASKSRYGWKMAKSTLILKTTNQPTWQLYIMGNNLQQLANWTSQFDERDINGSILYCIVGNYIIL